MMYFRWICNIFEVLFEDTSDDLEKHPIAVNERKNHFGINFNFNWVVGLSCGWFCWLIIYNYYFLKLIQCKKDLCCRVSILNIVLLAIDGFKMIAPMMLHCGALSKIILVLQSWIFFLISTAAKSLLLRFYCSRRWSKSPNSDWSAGVLNHRIVVAQVVFCSYMKEKCLPCFSYFVFWEATAGFLLCCKLKWSLLFVFLCPKFI